MCSSSLSPTGCLSGKLLPTVDRPPNLEGIRPAEGNFGFEHFVVCLLPRYLPDGGRGVVDPNPVADDVARGFIIQ